MRRDGTARYLVFQVWEFRGSIYDLDMYFIEVREGAACRTHVFRTEYYAVSIYRLKELMAEAGYPNVRQLDERFFQPLVVGERAEA